MGALNLTGQTFGRWRVLGPASVSMHWACVCDCGTFRDVYRGSLRNGVSKSCGCLNSELTGARSRTHGMTGHPAYTSWLHMRKRCLDPDCDDYKNWGGRGITVCERWSKFDAFWEDMGPTWVKHLTIERIDNDGNYEPGNCRWATKLEQANNQRTNHVIETSCGQLTLAEAARIFGINYWCLRDRVKRGEAGSMLFRPSGA